MHFLEFASEHFIFNEHVRRVQGLRFDSDVVVLGISVLAILVGSHFAVLIENATAVVVHI